MYKCFCCMQPHLWFEQHVLACPLLPNRNDLPPFRQPLRPNITRHSITLHLRNLAERSARASPFSQPLQLLAASLPVLQTGSSLRANPRTNTLSRMCSLRGLPPRNRRWRRGWSIWGTKGANEPSEGCFLLKLSGASEGCLFVRRLWLVCVTFLFVRVVIKCKFNER